MALTQDRAARKLAYDAQGRLQSVSRDGQQVAEYRYNALGQRIVKLTPESITTYLYGPGGQLLGEAEHDGSGRKLRAQYYLWLDSLPLATIDADYDAQGKLWKVREGYLIPVFETGTCDVVAFSQHNLVDNRYLFDFHAAGTGTDPSPFVGDKALTEVDRRIVNRVLTPGPESRAEFREKWAEILSEMERFQPQLVIMSSGEFVFLCFSACFRWS